MIFGFLFMALIAGFLARVLVPGRQPMSIGKTLLLGAAGSFTGGFIGWLLFHRDHGDGAIQTAGLTGSVIGSIIVLLLYRRYGKGAHR